MERKDQSSLTQSPRNGASSSQRPQREKKKDRGREGGRDRERERLILLPLRPLPTILPTKELCSYIPPIQGKLICEIKLKREITVNSLWKAGSKR